jgi:zinc protease
MNLVVRGGSAADPSDRAGLATVTADLLDEGTLARNALEISDKLSSIGANLNSSSDWDANRLTLTTLTRHFDEALSIYSDVLQHPAFRANDISRIRAQRLQGLVQSRDNASTIASEVYAALLYGAGHPYGHPQQGNQASIGAITESDLRNFYSAYYKPNNATLIVVGDVKPADVVAKLEKALSSWAPGTVPAVDVNARPAQRDHTTIYVVDRPGAAQSVINIGQVGVPRSTPDYFTRLVLNQMLGGAFVSRVNLNLREAKGYTYGARTSFDYRRGAGPFTASAGVQTAVTKESVSEFLKELRGIRGEIPVTEMELNQAKESLIRGFPRTFETPAQIAARLTDVALYGLSDNYFDTYISGIQKVTAADVARFAKEAIDPDHLAILVVGDRSVIEPGLKSLQGIGATVTVLDAEGHPLAAGSTQQQ